MAKGENITTKFTVDISDLKKGITEANNQIKLANAEFKAATAGMDNWAKSTDGIKAKLTQLDSLLASQKSKLDNYNKQLVEQQKAYDENGKRVAELKAKLQELATNGVSKTSDEYKKYENALASCEKEQDRNEKSINDLKMSILNQQAAVNKTEADINKYSKSLNTLEQEQKEAAEAANRQKTAYEQLESTIADQQKRLDELKGKYAAVVVEQGKNSKSAQDLADEIDQLSSELQDNKNKMSEADKAADELDNSLREAGDSADKASGGFTVMKGALANLVADGIRMAVSAMKDFVTESIRVGKEFDSSMSQVGAVSGATASELDVLREKAKEMGSTTKFTASEAADAFNYMAMAGWKTEDMLNGIDGVLNLAAASGADLATTSDIVTDALTAFGYSAKDAGRFADVMAAASSNANTNVEMMGETFKYVAPVAGALGFDIEDTAVAIGLMANAGIKGSQAGTALRSMFSRLAAPPKEAAEAMDALNISLTNADGTMKPLNAVLLEMTDRFSGLSEAEQAQYAKSIAGQEAMSGLLAIVNAAPADYTKLQESVYGASLTIDSFNQAAENAGVPIQDMRKAFEEAGISGDEFNEMLKLSKGDAESFAWMLDEACDAGFRADDILYQLGITTGDLQTAMDNSTGAAELMSETMQDNLGGDLVKLGSQFEGVQIAMYEKFEPALRDGVGALSKLLDGLSFVIEHSEAFVTAIEIAAASVGTFLVVMNWGTIMTAATKAITAVRTAVLALNAAILANPVAALAAAIAGLIVVTAKLIQHFFDEEKAIKSTKQAQEDLTAAKEEAANAENSYINAVDRATAAQQKLEEAEKASGLSGAELYKQVKDGTLDYANMTDQQKELYKAYIENEAAQKQVKESTEALTEAKKQETIASFENDLALAKESGSYDEYKQSVIDAYNEGTLSAEEARDLIGAAMSEMSRDSQKTFMEDIPSDITNGLEPTQYETKAQRLSKWFEDKWTGIKNTFKDAGEWFGKKFDDAKAKIKEKFEPVKKFFEDTWKAIKKVYSGVADWFGDKFTAAKNAIKTPLNAMIKLINKVIRGLNKLSIDIPDWVPEYGGKKFGFNIKEIPELATGGVLKRGQVGLLEGSGAEAVVPLEKNKQWIRAVASAMNNELSGGVMGSNNNISNSKVNNFTQIINAPKQPSRIELYRQTRNLLSYAGLKGGL